jgi:serine/threonine protein kinase
MKTVMKPFGRYFLLDLLTEGGMAEIHRAQMADPSGSTEQGKIIVIKRIQKPYVTDEEFHQMFWSEISLTMRFKHPNVVQLFDFGEEEGQPFLAMEYIHGISLRQLINKFAEAKKPFPVEFALYVIQQASLGLEYAHSFADELSGSQLNIVHRDMSPQNLLISFDGAIKVIDFGISKASNLQEMTKTGMLKGKPCYMAPEYVLGEKIDRRYDVFALGVMLWELLTGKRLFVGSNDLAVLKMVQEAEKNIKPPSLINLRLPETIDQIAMKALAAKPKERYQTAAELARDCEKILRGHFPEFEPTHFREVIQSLYSAQIQKDRSEIAHLTSMADSQIGALKLKPASVPTPPPPKTFTPPQKIPAIPIAPIDTKSASSVPIGRRSGVRQKVQETQTPFLAPQVIHDSSNSNRLWMGLTGVLAIALIWKSFQTSPPTQPPGTEIQERVPAEAKSAPPMTAPISVTTPIAPQPQAVPETKIALPTPPPQENKKPTRVTARSIPHQIKPKIQEIKRTPAQSPRVTPKTPIQETTLLPAQNESRQPFKGGTAPASVTPEIFD